MKRRQFLAIACATALLAACSKEPKPAVPVRQVSGTGRATAEDIFEAARTGNVPAWFSETERAAVDKIRE